MQQAALQIDETEEEPTGREAVSARAERTLEEVGRLVGLQPPGVLKAERRALATLRKALEEGTQSETASALDNVHAELLIRGVILHLLETETNGAEDPGLDEVRELLWICVAVLERKPTLSASSPHDLFEELRSVRALLLRRRDTTGRRALWFLNAALQALASMPTTTPGNAAVSFSGQTETHEDPFDASFSTQGFFNPS